MRSTSRSTRPSRTGYVGPRVACRKENRSANVRTVAPQYPRRAGSPCPACASASRAKRVKIGTPPIFRATTAAAARTANCASFDTREARCTVAAEVRSIETRRQRIVATVQVRYIVRDVDSAIAFYCGQLGFREIMHPAPAFAMLALGDLRLVLSRPNPAGGGGQPMRDGREQEPGGWNRF